MRKVLKTFVSLLVIATMLLSMASVSFASTAETTGKIVLSTNGVEDVTFEGETFKGVALTVSADVPDDYYAGWDEGKVKYDSSLFEFVGMEALVFYDDWGYECEWTLKDCEDHPDSAEVNVSVGEHQYFPYGSQDMVKLYFRVKDGAAGKSATFTPEGALIYYDYNQTDVQEMFGTMPTALEPITVDIPAEEEPTLYTVTYYTGEGEVYTQQQYEAGATITLPENPSKENYTFKGWDQELTTMPEQDLNVYAVWEKVVVKHTITYVIDGETVGTQEYEEGETIVALVPDEKAGFTFDGWANLPATMGTEDIIVTGSYTEIPAIPTSGTCGTSATWSFDEATGVLTISGTGAVKDYTSSDNAPWSADFGALITSVVVEEGITKIGNYAFYNDSLTEATLPSTLTEIGGAAFRGSSIEKITMPLVATVGNNAFNCEYLNTVIATGTKEQYYAMTFGATSGTNNKLLRANWTITEPDGNILHASMFNTVRWSYDEGEKKLQLDKSPYATKAVEMISFASGYKSAPWYPYMSTVEEIELNDIAKPTAQAFRNTSVKNLVINEGTTAIPAYTFAYNTKLETVKLPDSLATIGSYGFFLASGTGALKNITLNKNIDEFSELTIGSNNNIFAKRLFILNDGYRGWHSAYVYWNVNTNTQALTLEVTGSSSTAGVMASKGSGTAAEQPWYNYKDSVTSIVLPSGLKNIGKAAFREFTNVTELTIPSTVTDIGSAAFRGMTNLKTVTLTPAVKTVQAYAFNGVTLTGINYTGTKEKFDSISIGASNGNFKKNSSIITYNYVAQ